MRKKKNILLWIFIIIILFLILAILYIYITSTKQDKNKETSVNNPKDISNQATSNVIGSSGENIEVYFCPNDRCQEKILFLIDRSTDIKCAFYELNLPEMRQKLKEKNAEVIIENDNALPEFLTGYSDALMHNKFCIFDEKIVLTGSMNPTENCNYYNNNNIVIVESEELAKNYLDEFNELKKNIYGGGAKTKNTDITVAGINIENYFCPEDNCKLHVINALKKANQSIYFMTFSFTDKDIGNLLYNKDYEGKIVKGIFETRQVDEIYSQYNSLKKISILDKNDRTMHNKVFIIDNETVITGSFNPTGNANERNDENILIIHDKKIVEKYTNEFFRIYASEEKIPNNAQGMILNSIMYDPLGSDTGNEYIELKNNLDYEENLNYYFFSDNKTTSRLNGTISPGKVVKIKPKISLRNSNGTLILKQGDQIIDYVSWEGNWKLSATGVALTRINNNISELSWK